MKRKVTDDIFDFFGGNSPRKVEPLGQDDLFDDLMPKKPADKSEVEEEKVDSAAQEIAPEQEVAVEPVAEATARDTRSDAVEELTEDAETPAPSHWDSLMSTFGLEQAKKPNPKPVEKSAEQSTPKTKAKAKGKTTPQPSEPGRSKFDEIDVEDSIDDGVEIIEDVEVVQKSPAAEFVDDIFGENQVDKGSDESPDDVLSEMFVPSDNETDYEESVGAMASRADIEDDPFAAFHRAPENIDDDEPEVDEDLEEEPESSLIIDENFVEFDVRELDRGGSSKRQPRGGRRGRRDEPEAKTSERQPRDSNRSNRDSGRSDRDSNRSNRESERPARQSNRPARGHGQVDSADELQNDGDEAGGKRKRRRKRSRGDRQRDEVEFRDSGGSGDSGESRESKPRRGRDSRSRRSRNDDDRNNRDGGERKKQVPTWEDAINGVVDQNIKRHKSGSGRGGPRRRRNH